MSENQKNPLHQWISKSFDTAGLTADQVSSLVNTIQNQWSQLKQTVVNLNESRNKARPEDVAKAEVQAQADEATAEINLADAATSVPSDDPLDGVVVFYIDVGSLPPVKAEAYIEKLKAKFKPTLSRLRKNVGTLFIPVRNENTRVEWLKVDVPNFVPYGASALKGSKMISPQEALSLLKGQVLAQNPCCQQKKADGPSN